MFEKIYSKYGCKEYDLTIRYKQNKQAELNILYSSYYDNFIKYFGEDYIVFDSKSKALNSLKQFYLLYNQDFIIPTHYKTLWKNKNITLTKTNNQHLNQKWISQYCDFDLINSISEYSYGKTRKEALDNLKIKLNKKYKHLTF